MAQARRKTDSEFLGITLLHHVKSGLRESGFLLFGGVAVFLLAALLTFNPSDPAWTHTDGSAEVANLGGVTGAWFADISLYFLGYLAYALPLGAVYCAWQMFHRGRFAELDGEVVFYRTLGSVVALGAGCGLASLGLQPISSVGSGGGILGDVVGSHLIGAFGLFGAALFLLALFLAGFNLATGLSWVAVLDVIGASVLYAVAALARPWPLFDKLSALAGPAAESGPDRDTAAPTARRKNLKEKEKKAAKHSARVEPVIRPAAFDPAAEPDGGAWSAALAPVAAATALPDLDLLDQAEHENPGYNEAELEHMSRRVETLLHDFNIDVQVVAVEPGPVITRFELAPAPGVKVSQISNLSKDLARGLSVISVRVVEVIPGKSVIGLEIPNQQRQIVYLREVFDSTRYRNSASPLSLALGKDIGGKPVVADLGKMPHLLIAGTTGAGKSVAVNAMLLSILYKATPREVRLILVDPKMLELSVYEDIPHLLAPVVTDMKDAANALRWCVGEMERRYRLMAALKVRNIAGYNKKVGEAMATGCPIVDPLADIDPENPGSRPTLETLPFIVVVIDELADMMMIVGKKVEELIARLAQKARASGIHLILATQRPSVDVITGLIKANIPTRIAFQVSSKVDSRTILDQQGADTLLGHGDMLFLPPGTGFPQRAHGAFVADHEVHQVVDFLKQSGKPDYSEAVLESLQAGGSDNVVDLFAGETGGGSDDAESDPLYDQAVAVVLESRKASISYVQRRLKIGYNRAARMMEAMEAAGVIGPLETNGSRDVLIPQRQSDE